MSQRGFAPLVIIAVIGVLVLGTGAFIIFKPSPEPLPPPQPAPSPQPSAPPQPPAPPTTTLPSVKPTPTPAPTKSPLPPPPPSPSATPTPVTPPPSAQSLTPPAAPPSPTPTTLVNGKTAEQRLAEASDRLHTQGSAQHIRDNFPDIKLVYTDRAEGALLFPKEILPFEYFYSAEADTTFNICAINLTTFICKGKMDRFIRRSDVDSGRCNLTSLLLADTRL